jgi:hypothetical protein
MLKRRVPKPRVPQITRRALELFEQLQQIPRSTDVWYSVHDALHKELGARWFEWPLDCNVGGPYWAELEEAATAAAERRQVELAAAK